MSLSKTVQPLDSFETTMELSGSEAEDVSGHDTCTVLVSRYTHCWFIDNEGNIEYHLTYPLRTVYTTYLCNMQHMSHTCNKLTYCRTVVLSYVVLYLILMKWDKKCLLWKRDEIMVGSRLIFSTDGYIWEFT